jgi:hypothetical protein
MCSKKWTNQDFSTAGFVGAILRSCFTDRASATIWLLDPDKLEKKTNERYSRHVKYCAIIGSNLKTVTPEEVD